MLVGRTQECSSSGPIVEIVVFLMAERKGSAGIAGTLTSFEVKKRQILDRTGLIYFP